MSSDGSSGPDDRGPLQRVRAAVATAFSGDANLDLTSGGIGKPLFLLSLPIIVTNLLQVAYNLADTFWLGHYSKNALAAITFAFPMVFLLISLGMGISVAGSVLVAQYTGANQKRQATYAASQTVTFAFIVSAILGVTGYFFVEPFIAFLGASPAVLPGATAYMQIVAVGLSAMFGFFVFIALMRGSGDTVTPMLVMLGTVILNIVIDPFLIFGIGPIPELGVAGAAVATVFSRGLAMVVGLWIMLSGRRGVRILPGDMVPDRAYLRRLLRLGVPASIEGTGRAISVNLLLIVVGTFSTTIVAAFGVGVRIFSLVFMPAIAVDRGVETMTGQNLGAKKPERAERANHIAAAASFTVLSALGVVTWFTAPTVVSVFSPDQEVVRVGAEFLRWVAPTFGLIGVVRAYSGGFRGAGRTLTAAVISIVMLGVVRLPFAWVASRPVSIPFFDGTIVADILAYSLAENGIWLAFSVSNVVAGVLAYAWFTRGTWKDADLTDDDEDLEQLTVTTDDD